MISDDTNIDLSGATPTALNPEGALETNQIAPLDDLQKLFSRVKDSLLRSSTSVEPLIEAQNLVNILSAQVIAAANPLSEAQTNFFYDQFFKEVCSRAANCETKHGPSQEAVAELVRSLVDLLAAELKMQTETCLSLAKSMSPLLACSAKFHKEAFQKVELEDEARAGDHPGGDAHSGSVPVSEFNEDERMWRLALDVGTDIDVFKRDVKRKSQMWTMGKIVAVTGVVDDLARKRLTVKFHQDVTVTEKAY